MHRFEILNFLSLFFSLRLRIRIKVKFYVFMNISFFFASTIYKTFTSKFLHFRQQFKCILTTLTNGREVMTSSTVIANDIGWMMKWLMVYVGWIYHRCCCIERSLVMMHLWRMMHSQASQINVMGVVVRLWCYVIMTTIWICVVCIWLLSLRVFFVLHATVLEPEKYSKVWSILTTRNCKENFQIFTIFWLDALSNSNFSPAPSASALTRKR